MIKPFWILIITVFIVAFSTAAAIVYSGADPSEEAGAVAVEWFESRLQTHEAKRYELLLPSLQQKYKEGNTLEKDRPAENPQYKLTDYELTSWEHNENTFVFKIRYFSPKFDGKEVVEWVKVVRSGDRWAVSSLTFDERNAAPLIENKKPERMEELGA